MASLSEFFPTKWLKVPDLQGKDVKLTIQKAVREKIENRQHTGTEAALVCRFIGVDKGLSLHRTNALAIGAAYGDDYTKWDGRGVTLFSAMVDAFGEPVPAIRIRVTPENIQAVGEVADTPDPDSTGNDDLPF